MSQNSRTTFVDPILEWYDENSRHHLPWRDPRRSAFQLLVAEILLQRTTAATASGAYVPFVARYPTPESVVAALFSDLKDLIAPLGLAKRAEYIGRCAGQLLVRHFGRVPWTRSGLLDLHGVGEYTARSVLIHSFDGELSAVDTNVERLVARFFDVNTESHSIADFADQLVPRNRAAISFTPCWFSRSASARPSHRTAVRAQSRGTAPRPKNRWRMKRNDFQR